MRIGIGYDVHAFEQGRRLILGGVSIDGAPGLSGWSDADVLCHSVADALLGAASLGDLGSHFPQDKVEEGSSSLEILSRTAILVRDAGFRIENVDSTLMLQDVRIGRYCDEMADLMSRALKIEQGRVSVKATSTDHLGFVGRAEGAAALAVALLQRAETAPGELSA